MIFIGPNLNDMNAHFVTNVIDSIGAGADKDLILDILEIKSKSDIVIKIRSHLKNQDEKYIIYNAKEDEDFFFVIKKEFPELKLLMFFSDDEWRHSNYDRYLALFSDCFTIAVKSNLDKYNSYGMGNVFYMRWGCNPKKFYPVVSEKKYDVTFVGAAYGKRVEYVRYLLNNQIDIHVFGRGWDKYKDLAHVYGGCPDNYEMLEIIGQSKINLNFIWTSRCPNETTIKGRSLELAACNAFQLSNYTNEFVNYGFVEDENIAVFTDEASMLNKVKYYLGHEREMRIISESSFNHVTSLLTWEQLFNSFFKFMKEQPAMNLKKFKVLVINENKVDHNITREDERIEFVFIDNKDQVNSKCYDGVIELSRNSTIDNNAIYMMIFGLSVDESDLILSNFYIKSKAGLRWIRFKEKHLQSFVLSLLVPGEAMMLSGKYYSNMKKQHKGKISASYIEYPVAVIETGYIRSRLLRLHYGFVREFKKKFIENLNKRKYAFLTGLTFDKLWQEIINKK